MLFGHVFIALLVAISLSAILVPYRGRGAAWSDLIVFFVVVWLGTWALGAWITPVGPVVWGAPWLVFAFLGVIIALLVGAARPAGRPGRGSGAMAAAAEQAREGEAATAFSIFFWILTALLMVALVARYALIS